MPFALRDDLFFCLTDRCAIFLDLGANRYFGLTGSAEIAFRRIIAGDALDPALERAIQPLLKKGLMVEAEPATILCPPTLADVTRTLPNMDAPPPMAVTAMALLLRTRAALEMRVTGLKRMVDMRRRRKAETGGTADASPQTIERIVAAHRRADILVGSADRCLLRSLALIDHMARHGQFAQLVIGVRTGAFAAHCWVQREEVVLNDDVDRVRPYKPIMVL